MALSNKKRHIATFFNNDGEEVGQQEFNPKKKYFKYDKKAYNINLRDSSRFKISGFWKDTYYYIYALNHPDPKFIEKGDISVFIDPEEYRAILDSKALADVNDVDNEGILGGLTGKQILYGLVIVGVLWYALSNGVI